MHSWRVQCAPGRAVIAAPLLPPQPARCRRRHHCARWAAVQCTSEQQSSQGDFPRQQQQQQQRNVDSGMLLLTLKAVMLGTAGSAVLACLPGAVGSASAASSSMPGSWQPRRHIQSRLRERFASQETPKQAAERRAAEKQAAAAAAAQQAAAQPAASGGEVHQLVQAAQRKWQQLWQKEEVYKVGISTPRHQAYGPAGPPAPSPYGWVPLTAAGALLLWLVFGRNLRLPWGGSRRGQGGRWVRDRSLGGKMVFIPDAEPLPKAPRPLWEDLDDGSGGSGAAGAVSSSGSGSGSSSSSSDEAAGGPWATARPAGGQLGRAERRQERELPAWWSLPNFAVYTPFSRKDELQRQARIVLRQLEDGKLLQGLDYPLSALVTLRTLCQEAGGYQVKPRTDNARDEMLRTGVRSAIAAAQESQFAAAQERQYLLLGGEPPARFVCGLAHVLGVPDEKAVAIVHGAVAEVCKAALIDAEAAYRAGNQPDLLVALMRVAGALQAFPLPAGSAQAEMVAAGVVRQTSLEFRKAIFLEFGSVSSSLAAIVAELLGFDPSLVLPYLEQQQAAAAAAAQAAAQAAAAAMAGQQPQAQAQQAGEQQ